MDTLPSEKLLYVVVESDGSAELAIAVRAYIDLGWQPIGGVAVAVSNEISMRDGDGSTQNFFIFAQAMVKHER
jgi:hypothetical protein